MSFDDDLNACAQLVEKGDPWRFRTVMAAPVAARAKLFPLYAFNVEVSRAPWVTAEPMIAEMRLQWWRDALEEIAAKSGVRRHSVVTPLASVLTPQMAKALDDSVAARRWDCYKDPFEDAAHLDRYLRNTSGRLMQVAAHILGADTGAENAGFGFGVAAWMQAIPALEAQKRIPLVDGTPDGVQQLARAGLDALASAPRRVPRAAVSAFWPAFGARGVLSDVIRDPGRVAAGRVTEPRRTWFALAAATGRW